MITDPVNFNDFGLTYLSDSTSLDLFKFIFYTAYHIDEKKSVSQNEKAMLSAL